MLPITITTATRKETLFANANGTYTLVWHDTDDDGAVSGMECIETMPERFVAVLAQRKAAAADAGLIKELNRKAKAEKAAYFVAELEKLDPVCRYTNADLEAAGYGVAFHTCRLWLYNTDSGYHAVISVNGKKSPIRNAVNDENTLLRTLSFRAAAVTGRYVTA